MIYHFLFNIFRCTVNYYIDIQVNVKTLFLTDVLGKFLQHISFVTALK